MPPVSVDQGFLAYANSVSLTFSAIDFVLEFSQDAPIGPTSEQDEFTVERRLVSRIAISPPQAAALKQALQHDLDRYRKQYGPIAVPEITPSDEERSFGEQELAPETSKSASPMEDQGRGAPKQEEPKEGPE